SPDDADLLTHRQHRADPAAGPHRRMPGLPRDRRHLGTRAHMPVLRAFWIHDVMTLPELHLADWRATKDTLHLYSQIMGKIRLATTPPRNHWWNVPLYVDVRRLPTRRLHH